MAAQIKMLRHFRGYVHIGMLRQIQHSVLTSAHSAESCKLISFSSRLHSKPLKQFKSGCCTDGRNITDSGMQNHIVCQIILLHCNGYSGRIACNLYSRINDTTIILSVFACRQQKQAICSNSSCVYIRPCCCSSFICSL